MPCASSSRVGFGFVLRNPTVDITKPGHAERALEALLVDHGLLHRMQLAVRRLEALRSLTTLLVAHRVREDRARVVRHIVDQHRAGAALGAIAAKLGAGEAELVAQRHRERFLLHHVDAAHAGR